MNSCLLHNYSECPDQYKMVIVKNFISRAQLISSCTLYLKELSNVKQMEIIPSLNLSTIK